MARVTPVLPPGEGTAGSTEPAQPGSHQVSGYGGKHTMPFKSIRMTATKSLNKTAKVVIYLFFWSSTAQRRTWENASFGVRKKCSNQQTGLKFLTPKGNSEAFLEQIEPLLSQAFTYLSSSPTSRGAIMIPFQGDLVPAGKGACVLPARGRGGRHTSPAEAASCFYAPGNKSTFC